MRADGTVRNTRNTARLIPHFGLKMNCRRICRFQRPPGSAERYGRISKQEVEKTHELKNWYGLTQADQARLRNVSRQAINDGMMKELAGASRINIDIPEQLTVAEKLVYVLMSDGKNYREISRILNLGSKSKICRVGQSIASKMGKNGTIEFLKNKKNQKNVKYIQRRKNQRRKKKKNMLKT